MTLSEFDIISQFFKKKYKQKKSIIAGIGDDAAIVEVPSDKFMAVSTDTLVSGVHFPMITKPFDIAYKSLAVNISDMAAMGAEPLYVTLAITLEHNDAKWLEDFSNGFFSLANEYSIDLIGGDVSRGPLSITVQIFGVVPKGQEIMRSGAKPGDAIYVTGKLGMAAYGLHMLNKGNCNIDKLCLQRLNRPEPRLDIGMALRNKATACIDISDGLKADLSHLLDASMAGAEIEIEQIPFYSKLHDISSDLRLSLGMLSGDDYELCFTLNNKFEIDVKKIEKEFDCEITRIGTVKETPGINWNNKYNLSDEFINSPGYLHF